MSRPAFRNPPSPADPPAEKPRAGNTPTQPRPARGAPSQSAASSPAETEPRTATSSHVVRGDYSVRFTHPGEHEAMHAAEDWCKARGFSVGALQADAPRGILLGDVSIAKWRNLDGQDREDLHGVMEAPWRTWRSGPVTITIRRDAPAAVIEAFRSEPEPADAAGEEQSHPTDCAAQAHIGGRA